MVYDQQVYHKWHVFLIFVFFMSYPEPPMGISSGDSFPVQSGGSLIFIFQLFSCVQNCLHIWVHFRCSWQVCGGLSGIWVFFAVCVHPLVHFGIHTSVSMSMYCLYIFMSMGMFIQCTSICTSMEHLGRTSICLSGIAVSVSTSICLSEAV